MIPLILGPLLGVLAPALPQEPAHPSPPWSPHIEPASHEGQTQIKRFQVAPGLEVSLIAAEPDVANPVCLTIDERGRFYVAECYRIKHGVYDVRDHMDWLDDDLASRTTADRAALLRKHLKDKVGEATQACERVRMLEKGADGTLHSTVFADGFNDLLDGVGAGLLAWHGDVLYTCIPKLWRLSDRDGDGVAEERKVLHEGFGVHVSLMGHDMHGLRVGPDRRLYFSIGDRGFCVPGKGGALAYPDMGAVLRCELDGSNLEVFASGLRNPQELAFDQLGNLFTGDNNSDGGDAARWVYVMEGGDCGWRIWYQWLADRGPWNREGLWHLPSHNQPAAIVPPVALLGDGPAGLAYYPGTGLPARFADHFFLCDFRGSAATSGIHTLRVQPLGAGFELAHVSWFLWHVLATDADFGSDGGLYLTDWVAGWQGEGKGRIYRVFDPQLSKDPVVEQTQRLLAEGMARRPLGELIALLDHPDQRVRMEAQFECVDRARAQGAAHATAQGAAHATAQDPSHAAAEGPAHTAAEGPSQATADSPARASVPSDAAPGAAGAVAKGVDPNPAAAKASATKPPGALDPVLAELVKVAQSQDHLLARVHAIWALALIGRKERSAVEPLVPLLGDGEAEIRAQAAKALGEDHGVLAAPKLRALLRDANARVRAFAAMSLGKLHDATAVPAVLGMLRENDDRDPWLRHAGVMALTWIGHVEALLAAAGDASPAARLGVLLALRRLERPEVAQFLADPEPRLVAEAARAIHDVPIDAAMPQLASLLDRPGLADEALLRRVVNAAFRTGGARQAAALVAFACRDGAPPSMRIEALRALEHWEQPPPRDAVLGAWRPLAARDGAVAKQRLEPQMKDLLRRAPDPVRAVAAEVAGRLAMGEQHELLAKLCADVEHSASVRTRALEALMSLKDKDLEKIARAGAADPSVEVREGAIRVLAKVAPDAAIAAMAHVLQVGEKAEQQNALTTLGGMPQPTAQAVLLHELDELAAGRVPPEIRLDLLDAAAKPGAASLAAKLAQLEAARPKDDPLATWRETLAGGDIKAGRKVFYEHQAATCVRCHSVEAYGGTAGPELAEVGKRLSREQLLEALILPSKTIAPGYGTVVAVMRDGTMQTGTAKSEDQSKLVLLTPDGVEVTLARNEIDTLTQPTSAMPPMGTILTKREVRDLVEYLSSLTGKKAE